MHKLSKSGKYSIKREDGKYKVYMNKNVLFMERMKNVSLVLSIIVLALIISFMCQINNVVYI